MKPIEQWARDKHDELDICLEKQIMNEVPRDTTWKFFAQFYPQAELIDALDNFINEDCEPDDDIYWELMDKLVAARAKVPRVSNV